MKMNGSLLDMSYQIKSLHAEIALKITQECALKIRMSLKVQESTGSSKKVHG